MSETNSASVPVHLGFILDGNRRWAQSQGLPTLEGHRRGYNNLKDISEAAFNRGVKFVTAFIFSTENWNRAKEEVSYLMDLALIVFSKDLKQLHQKGYRVCWLGRPDNLSTKHIEAIRKGEELTKNNTKGTLGLCFNYGGQQEIVDAAKALLAEKTDPDSLNEKLFADKLYAPDIPPIDLIVRTSGEQRISNFMLWRAAYSELYFTDKHWPAFTEADLDTALKDYAKRQRRFGS